MRPCIAFVAVLLWQTIAFGQAAEMLAHSNAIRLAANKSPQPIDDKLCAMAQDHADYLARNRISIWVPGAHALNGGVDARARRHGFSGRVGENIAGDFSSAANAFALGWDKSEYHRQTVISDDYDLCGFGHQKDSQGLNYWVAVYGQQPLANRHYFVPSVDTATLCHVCGESVYHKIHPWKNVSQEQAHGHHEQAPAKAQVSAVCGPAGCGTSGNAKAAARPTVRVGSRVRGFRLLPRNRK